MRYIGLIMLALALAGCGGSHPAVPATPAGQASALLARTGAKATGAAYLPGPDSGGVCNSGDQGAGAYFGDQRRGA